MEEKIISVEMMSEETGERSESMRANVPKCAWLREILAVGVLKKTLDIV